MSSSRLVPTIPSLALVATLIVALAFIGLHFYLSQPQPVLIDPSSSGEAYTTYQDDKFGVSFAYPKNWGTVIALPGNRNLEAGPNCSANGPAFEGGACVGLCLSDERLTFSAKQIPGQEQIGSSSAAEIDLLQLDPKHPVRLCQGQYAIDPAQRWDDLKSQAKRLFLNSSGVQVFDTGQPNMLSAEPSENYVFLDGNLWIEALITRLNSPNTPTSSELQGSDEFDAFRQLINSFKFPATTVRY